MMTKQHYIEFAKALYGVLPDASASNECVAAWEKAYDIIEGVLASDNPRFDTARFRDACTKGLVQARANTKPRKAF